MLVLVFLVQEAHWLYVTTIEGPQAKARLKALNGRKEAYFRYNTSGILFQMVIVNKDKTHSNVTDSYGEGLDSPGRK